MPAEFDPLVSSRLPRLPGYRWLVVAMLWCVCFFNYADRQAIYAVFPVLEREFGFDKAQLGLIGSAFMWVYAAGALFAGWVCDRAGRKTLILGGCFLWSVVTVTTAWCAKLWQFVTVRALEGFGETFYFPASMSFISDYHGGDTRSRAMSWHQSSVYIGTIGGSWFGGFLAEHWGWRSGFYLFGISGTILSLALWGLLVERPRGAAETSVPLSDSITQPLPFFASLRDAFSTATSRCLLVAFLGANFVATVFLAWMPTFLKEKFEYNLAAAALWGTVFIHLASALTVPVAGWLADTMVRRFRGGRMMPQVLGLAIGAVFVAIVGSTTSKTTLFISMAAFGACKGCYDAGIFATLFDVVPIRSRGIATGVMNTVGWGGGALGPLAAGYYATYGSYGSDIANMSHFISWCGAVYVAAAGCLVAAIIFQRRAVSEQLGNAHRPTSREN